MKISKKIIVAVFMTLFIALPGLSFASGFKLIERGGRYLKVGAQLQLQNHWSDPDTNSVSDEDDNEVHFRRLRPYIEVSPQPGWLFKGEVDVGEMRWHIGEGEWEMGDSKSANKVTVQNVYLQYKGIEGIKITLGNADLNFSRELMTSSKRQQLIERTFVGDHNYGVPDKQPGLHVAGSVLSEKLMFGVSTAIASIDPDDDKIDFDTPVNRHSDFNDGYILGGRMEITPFGAVALAQGDLKRDMKKFSIGGGAYHWINDDDENKRTSDAGADLSGGSKPDVDKVTGVEVVATVRFRGLSADLQYNYTWAETIDPTVTSGLYVRGEAEIESVAIEGGFTVLPERLEIVGGFQVLNSDTYTKSWRRSSIGANLFLKGHDTKLQATYRIGENVGGMVKNNLNEFFFQAQLLF